MSSRNRILEIAISTIEKHGEAGLRVDEIAAQAEVAKPSLYHFFKSRDGLVAAAQAERYRRSLVLSLRNVVERLSAAESAEHFADLLFEWMTMPRGKSGPQPRSMSVDVLGSSVSRPLLQSQIRQETDQLVAQFAEVAQAAAARGWIQPSADFDYADFARWLQAAWHGRYLAEISDNPAHESGWDQVMKAALTRLLIDGGR